MVRLAGVIIPQNKRIEIALTYIYGIGRTTSNEILAKLKISPNVRVNKLSETEVQILQEEIAKHHRVEGDLRRAVAMDIKRLQEIGTYRGYRHKRNLPVRGQNTRTNARTKRGARKTIANKKKEG